MGTLIRCLLTGSVQDEVKYLSQSQIDNKLEKAKQNAMHMFKSSEDAVSVRYGLWVYNMNSHKLDYYVVFGKPVVVSKVEPVSEFIEVLEVK